MINEIKSWNKVVKLSGWNNSKFENVAGDMNTGGIMNVYVNNDDHTRDNRK